MSHFTVIVIGEDIEGQLAPFDESSGNKSHMVFVSQEEESRHEYETKKIEVVVLADGSWKYKYDDEFLVNKEDLFNKKYNYPTDSQLKELPLNSLFLSFEEFMEEYHGQTERDSSKNEYGYWSNPNAKWDWWSIGGRWTGYFKPKAGCSGELGRPGVFDNKPNNGMVDSILVGDIDVPAMLQDSINEANKTYDELEAVLKGRPLPSWNLIYKKHGENVTAARDEYNSLEVVQDLNRAKFFIFGDYVEVFGPDRASYVERCKNSTMVPFAVVHKGKWYQKGEMGWFGMSSDEMNQDEWNSEFWKMINSLAPDTKLTLIDCHI